MTSIINTIEKEFYSFDIVQLVNVINEIFCGDDADDRPRIFFETDPSLSFPSSDIGAVSIDDNEKSAAITLSVMNLLGISSPLPIKFSDYIARSRPDADFYRDFLSIAQNRLHKLWLDAQQKNACWNTAADTARAILESTQTRNSSTLKQLIKSTWENIPVVIEENIERRTAVNNARPLGSNLRLGQNAITGTKVRDRTSKFRISLGPLEYDIYNTFLPGESNHQRLQSILSSYLNEPLICELEISCRQADLSPARLGGVPDGCLGRTIKLGMSAVEDRVRRYRTLAVK